MQDCKVRNHIVGVDKVGLENARTKNAGHNSTFTFIRRRTHVPFYQIIRRSESYFGAFPFKIFVAFVTFEVIK